MFALLSYSTVLFELQLNCLAKLLQAINQRHASFRKMLNFREIDGGLLS